MCARFLVSCALHLAPVSTFQPFHYIYAVKKFLAVILSLSFLVTVLHPCDCIWDDFAQSTLIQANDNFIPQPDNPQPEAPHHHHCHGCCKIIAQDAPPSSFVSGQIAERPSDHYNFTLSTPSQLGLFRPPQA